MSGRVKVKYINLPITLLYILGSANNFPSYFESLRFYSIGNLTGFDPRKPISFKISSAYFLCVKSMPTSVLATSRPKKYLKEPTSFKPNLSSSNYFKLLTQSGLFPVSKMSSTYTKSTIKEAL